MWSQHQLPAWCTSSHQQAQACLILRIQMCVHGGVASGVMLEPPPTRSSPPLPSATGGCSNSLLPLTQIRHGNEIANSTLLSLPVQSLNSRCRAAKYGLRPPSQRIVLTNQLSSVLGRGDPQRHPVPGG